jgi:hypothetical protein
MAHRHPYITYSGSSSDEAWTRNTSPSIRPSRRVLSSSEGEESDRRPSHTGFFGRTYNVSSDSDRYNSTTDYESSDSDRKRNNQRRGYQSSDSEEYFSEDEEGSYDLWKKLRPWSVIGALALAVAMSLPYLMDRSFNKSYSSWSTPKVSKIMDSMYYTASSLVPGVSRRAGEIVRPDFVYEHPYVSSSYYTSTNDTKVLMA